MRLGFNLTIDFTIWHVRYINFSNNNNNNNNLEHPPRSLLTGIIGEKTIFVVKLT